MMISDLKAATLGSAAADLPLAENVLLSPGGGVYKLRTNVFGPLPRGNFGLILGRSSATLRGLTVYPGVIDSDYAGEILIMVSTSQTLSLLEETEAQRSNRRWRCVCTAYELVLCLLSF